jgi:hypothetical protein
MHARTHTSRTKQILTNNLLNFVFLLCFGSNGPKSGG